MQKLLLADDSVTIQRVIELTFSGEAVQVVAVNDGEQAIARIPLERPDIVLADIGMPKKGGYDVAAFVKGRADLQHIPVLLLAGAFEPVDQARAEQVRCDGVLIKPFEPRQVVERVRELLDGAAGSAAQATADVARPVERLAPRLDPRMPHPTAATPAPPAPRAAVTPPDPVLDDYFESLNSAFANVGRHGAAARAVVVPAADDSGAEDAFWFEDVPSPPTPRAPRRRSDSLDEYFDRLSTAVDHARASAAEQALHQGSAAPLRPSREGTNGRSQVRASAAGVQAPGSKANGHAAVHGRNPIVEALEALLAVPEPASAERPALQELQPTLPGLPDLFPAEVPEGPHDLADEVAERVLSRLVPEIAAAVRRLAQEEVDRIRRGH